MWAGCTSGQTWTACCCLLHCRALPFSEAIRPWRSILKRGILTLCHSQGFIFNKWPWGFAMRSQCGQLFFGHFVWRQLSSLWVVDWGFQAMSPFRRTELVSVLWQSWLFSLAAGTPRSLRKKQPDLFLTLQGNQASCWAHSCTQHHCLPHPRPEDLHWKRTQNT